MGITGIGDSLQDMLAAVNADQLLGRKRAEEIVPEPGQVLAGGQGTLAAEIVAEKTSLAAAARSSNPMDRNFVSREREQSRYVAARLEAFKAERQTTEARQGSAAALLDEFGGVNVSGTYNPQESHGSSHYERRIRQINEEKLLQESAARMKQERREQDARLAEAAGTAPLPESGVEPAAPQAVSGQAPLPQSAPASQPAQPASPATEPAAASDAPAPKVVRPTVDLTV